MQFCTNYVSTYIMITSNINHHLLSNVFTKAVFQTVTVSCLDFYFCKKIVSLISCNAHNLRVCLCLCVVCGAYTCISNTTPLSDLAVIRTCTLAQGCIAPEGRGWISLAPGNFLWARHDYIIVCSRMCKTFHPGSHTHKVIS